MSTPTFKRVSLAQFQQIIRQFKFTRWTTSVCMHHTWRPRRMDFRGHETIGGMWRHHTGRRVRNAEDPAPAFWPGPIRASDIEVQDPPDNTPSTPLPNTPAVRPDKKGYGPVAGRRRALCVGVDAYPDAGDRLGGCVNDARRWGQVLAGLGFQATLLLDGQASHAAIEHGLRRLVTDSRPGDVIVFHFSGHGTRVDDLDGEEDDGLDEALCPVDFRTGALFLDDDIGRILKDVPHDVNMTLFVDACHSGTVTRFAVGGAKPRPPDDYRARYVKPTPQLQEAHRRFRAKVPATRAISGNDEAAGLAHVKFSACQDHELALESNGSGEFTRRALQILQGGIAGLTHAQFQARLLTAFGSLPRQNPRLDCADDIKTRDILQPCRNLA
jgi:hypothetical protein